MTINVRQEFGRRRRSRQRAALSNRTRVRDPSMQREGACAQRNSRSRTSSLDLPVVEGKRERRLPDGPAMSTSSVTEEKAPDLVEVVPVTCGSGVERSWRLCVVRGDPPGSVFERGRLVGSPIADAPR